MANGSSLQWPAAVQRSSIACSLCACVRVCACVCVAAVQGGSVACSLPARRYKTAKEKRSIFCADADGDADTADANGTGPTEQPGGGRAETSDRSYCSWMETQFVPAPDTHSQ